MHVRTCAHAHIHTRTHTHPGSLKRTRLIKLAWFTRRSSRCDCLNGRLFRAHSGVLGSIHDRVEAKDPVGLLSTSSNTTERREKQDVGSSDSHIFFTQCQLHGQAFARTFEFCKNFILKMNKFSINLKMTWQESWKSRGGRQEPKTITSFWGVCSGLCVLLW